MGRDIAGRKDRDGRMSGSQAQIVGGDHVLRSGSASSSSFSENMRGRSSRSSLCVIKDNLGEWIVHLG